MTPGVAIVRRPDLPQLERLWAAIARDEGPGDAGAVDAAIQGLRRASVAFDYLDSDSFWIFAAEAGGDCVGYAAVARVPKLDDRIGFLHVDELHVLAAHRRRGHARRLLERAESHAAGLELRGLRLLVDPANVAAGRLYDALGFAARGLIFRERLGDPGAG